MAARLLLLHCRQLAETAVRPPPPQPSVSFRLVIVDCCCRNTLVCCTGALPPPPPVTGSRAGGEGRPAPGPAARGGAGEEGRVQVSTGQPEAAAAVMAVSDDSRGANKLTGLGMLSVEKLNDY